MYNKVVIFIDKTTKCTYSRIRWDMDISMAVDFYREHTI